MILHFWFVKVPANKKPKEKNESETGQFEQNYVYDFQGGSSVCLLGAPTGSQKSQGSYRSLHQILNLNGEIMVLPAHASEAIKLVTKF
jgi:hypothetical protein